MVWEYVEMEGWRATNCLRQQIASHLYRAALRGNDEIIALGRAYLMFKFVEKNGAARRNTRPKSFVELRRVGS